MKTLLLLLVGCILASATKVQRGEEVKLRDNYDVLSIEANFIMEDSFLIEKLCLVLLENKLKIKAASTKLLQFSAFENIDILEKDIRLENNNVTRTDYNKQNQVLSIFLQNAVKKGDIINISIAYRVKFQNNVGFIMLAEKTQSKKEYMIISNNSPKSGGMLIGKDSRDSRSKIKLSVTIPDDYQVSTSLVFKEKYERRGKNAKGMTYNFESSQKIPLVAVTIAVHRLKSDVFECEGGSKITVIGSKKIVASPEAAVDAACYACKMVKEEFGYDCFKDSKEIQLLGVPESISTRPFTPSLMAFAEESMIYNNTRHIRKIGYKVVEIVTQSLLEGIIRDMILPKGTADDWVASAIAGFFTRDKSIPFDGYNPVDKLAYNLNNLKEYEAMTPNSIALSESIYSSYDINQRRDTVMSLKSTAFLMMLNKYYGEEFKPSIKKFVKEYSGKEFTTDVFLNYISKGDALRFKSFLNRPGVRIVKCVERDTLTCKQNRASKLQRDKINNQIDFIVDYTVPSDPKKTKYSAIFDKTMSRNNIQMSRSGTRLILNTDGTGYFIAEYGNADYALNQAVFKKLSMSQQAQYLGDLWILCMLNKINFKDCFNTIKVSLIDAKPLALLMPERMYFDILPHIDESDVDKFNANYWSIIKPSYEKFLKMPQAAGAQMEETWSSLNTVAIIAGDPNATKVADAYFKDWDKKRNVIPPKEKAGVFCRGFSNPDFIPIMIDEWRSFVDNQDKRLMYSSVRCMRNPDKFRSILADVSKNFEEFNREFFTLILKAGQKFFWKQTWDFISKENPKSILETYLNVDEPKILAATFSQSVRTREHTVQFTDWMTTKAKDDNIGVDETYIARCTSNMVFALHNNLEQKSQIYFTFFNIRTSIIDRLKSQVETTCALNQALHADRKDGSGDSTGNEDYCEEDGLRSKKSSCMVMLKNSGKTTCDLIRSRKQMQLKEGLKANATIISNPVYKTQAPANKIEFY